MQVERLDVTFTVVSLRNVATVKLVVPGRNIHEHECAPGVITPGQLGDRRYDIGNSHQIACKFNMGSS